MNKLWTQIGFKSIKWVQPREWELNNDNFTMNAEEKKIFNEYVFEMRNAEMCGFVMEKKH